MCFVCARDRLQEIVEAERQRPLLIERTVRIVENVKNMSFSTQGEIYCGRALRLPLMYESSGSSHISCVLEWAMESDGSFRHLIDFGSNIVIEAFEEKMVAIKRRARYMPVTGPMHVSKGSERRQEMEEILFTMIHGSTSLNPKRIGHIHSANRTFIHLTHKMMTVAMADDDSDPMQIKRNIHSFFHDTLRCPANSDLGQSDGEMWIRFELDVDPRVDLNVKIKQTNHDRYPVSAFFNHTNETDDQLIREEWNLGDESNLFETVKKLTLSYLSLFQERQEDIVTLCKANHNTIIDLIEDTPQWEDVDFLQSIMGQIEDRIDEDDDQVPRDVLSNRQIEVVEKIHRERTYEDDHRDDHIVLIHDIMDEHVLNAGEVDSLNTMIYYLEKGEFLTKSSKMTLIDIMTSRDIPLERWGFPLVDLHEREYDE